MSRGRQTRPLALSEVEWLRQYRLAGALSVRALRAAMRPPFTAATLGKALHGLPVYELYAAWLTNWIAEQNYGEKGQRATPVVSRGR